MFETGSTAVDPLVVQLNDELNSLEPRVANFGTSLEDIQNIIPPNLSTTIFKFKGDLDRLERADEKRRIFKRIPNEKSVIIDFESKIHKEIDQKVHDMFDSSKHTPKSSTDYLKEKTNKLNQTKTKITSALEGTKAEIDSMAKEISLLIPKYNSGSSVPSCLVTKLEKDVQSFERQISELDSEIDSYLESVRIGKAFQSKFGDMLNVTVEVEDPSPDDGDKSAEKYKVPNLSVPFYSFKADVDNMILSLTGEASEIDNKYNLIEKSIQSIEKMFQETVTDQEDMAVVLHNVEDKTLEMLCDMDQAQENMDTISITDDVDVVRENMGKTFTEVKEMSSEVKRMILKMEDDYDHAQVEQFISK